MTGGSLTIAGNAGGATPVSIFSASADGGGCETFIISNRSSSAGPVLVTINGLHSNGAVPVQPGQSWPFRYGSPGANGGITSVMVAGDGVHAATLDYGVCVRM